MDDVGGLLGKNNVRGVIMKHKIQLSIVLVLLLLFTIMGCSNSVLNEEAKPSEHTEVISIDENGEYSTPEEVAQYISIYKELPKNYITKEEAVSSGWESSKGNLWDVTDRMSIGGDVFGNREGKLPDTKGRQWYECDVNYNGGFRGEERLVYSNDGLIFYSKDHYNTFIEMEKR